MEIRNFYILIASICITTTAIWLSAYNIVRLGIDPIEYIKSGGNVFEEDQDDDIVVTIRGNVKEELKLTLSDIKSSKYRQITDDFDFKNSYGREWTTEYTGATLWSILEAEGLLESDSSTFVFIGEDGYESPTPLSIKDIAEKYEDKVILAYEVEGSQLVETGPIRSIIDREVIENENIDYPNSQFAVQNLRYIEIE